jgi:hypothetical protein
MEDLVTNTPILAVASNGLVIYKENGTGSLNLLIPAK